MKKTIALFLAVSLSTAMFAGCSGKSESGAGVPAPEPPPIFDAQRTSFAHIRVEMDDDFAYDGLSAEYGDGLIRLAKKADGKVNKVGYVDKSGNEVIPFVYDNGWGFSEGLAAVEKNGRWGFINTSGNEVIPLSYDEARPFQEGYAFVRRGDYGNYGVIDKNGREVTPFIYGSPYYFQEGLASVSSANRGFIDTHGNVAIPLTYINADSFSNGLAAVGLADGVDENGRYINRRQGFIDKSGNEAIPFIYDNAWGFREGLAAVEQSNNWGFVNKEGKEVVALVYSNVHNFQEGFAAISKGNGWGFIDTNGNEVIQPKYSAVRDFQNGFAAVCEDGRWGFIDKSGKVIVSPIYDEVSSFDNGTAVVFRGGGFGLIDETGLEISPIKASPYYSIVDYSNPDVKVGGNRPQISYIVYVDGVVIAELMRSTSRTYELYGNIVLAVSDDKDFIESAYKNVFPAYETAYQAEVARFAGLNTDNEQRRKEETERAAEEAAEAATRSAAEAQLNNLKQDLVGKWLDADGNLAYTITEDMHVEVGNGWTSGSCTVQDGALVMRYGVYTVYDEVPVWLISMPNHDTLILTYGEQREELSRKPSAPSGGLSAKDIEKNIVGTWVRSTPQGEEKLRFMKDGTYSATSVMSIVTEGTYYFEGGSLFIQTQTLLGKVESGCTPSMDSKDSLWLTSKSGDSENYTRKQ